MAARAPSEPTAGEPPLRERVRSGRLYVPVYSHIYTKEGTAEDLAITISVRNVSPHRSLILESVDYYDTSGKLLDHFMESPAEVHPLETVEFFVGTQDRRGGSGANFLVTWHADSPVLKPLVEAVMVRAVSTNQAYAFSTRAIEVPTDAPKDAPPAPAPQAEKGEAAEGESAEEGEDAGEGKGVEEGKGAEEAQPEG